MTNRVWVITDQHNQFVAVSGDYQEAMDMAEELEKSGEYPLDSLYVDEYSL